MQILYLMKVNFTKWTRSFKILIDYTFEKLIFYFCSSVYQYIDFFLWPRHCKHLLKFTGHESVTKKSGKKNHTFRAKPVLGRLYTYSCLECKYHIVLSCNTLLEWFLKRNYVTSMNIIPCKKIKTCSIFLQILAVKTLLTLVWHKTCAPKVWLCWYLIIFWLFCCWFSKHDLQISVNVYKVSWLKEQIYTHISFTPSFLANCIISPSFLQKHDSIVKTKV
jgi:hypothetical protein